MDSVDELEKKDSILIVSRSVGQPDDRYRVMKNGDVCNIFEGEESMINVLAVPAYNVGKHKPDGTPFHSKGDGNGYILTFGDFKIYIAGDTEEIPDMKYFPYSDLAFLPKDPVYTMSDEEFIACANFLRPKYLYPYHYGRIDIPMLKRYLDTGITLVTPPVKTTL
jgi:L-ascorbate metabolism protein UlaG (beta-lactamase superfamily)